MVYLHPRPPIDELKPLYGREYYDSWGSTTRDASAAREMKKRTFARWLRTIGRSLDKGKVLDVGCAMGYLLEAAQEQGWDVYGVELSEYSASLAREKFGDRIFNGSLEDARLDGSAFDLVTLSDVLEHVPDLVPFLGEIRRILRGDGFLMIVTPDVSSLTAKVMRSRWSHLKPEHLYYFSPSSVKDLLSRCGFSVVLSEGAPKYLNLRYVLNQFRTYEHRLLTPTIKLLDRLLPPSMKDTNVPFYCGEMMVLAAKRDPGDRPPETDRARKKRITAFAPGS